MSADPDEAIEKLAQYRATSKRPSFKSESDAKATHDSPVRTFFLKYYWFNATVVTTLIVAMLIGGWSILAGIWVSLILLLLVVLARQTFRTITRLENSDGRNTTLDDMFIIFLIAGSFFFYSFFDLVPQSKFVTFHLILSIIWILQILFVNYLKPELGISKTSGIAEEVETEESIIERIRAFLTKERSIVLGISVILGSIIALL